jgi:hypothetical protein
MASAEVLAQVAHTSHQAFTQAKSGTLAASEAHGTRWEDEIRRQRPRAGLIRS